MAAIEGYRFSIDLDDHGMSEKLTKLSREASTLSRIMRATSGESMAYGNTFSALSQKIQYSGKAIEGYEAVIRAAQRDMENLPAGIRQARQELAQLGTITDKNREQAEKLKDQIDDESKRRLTLVNRIENSRNAIARLVRQQQAAEQQQRIYNGTLEQYRSINAGMTSTMRSYSALLKEEGAATLTTKNHVQALIRQRDMAKTQYGLEIDQTKRLQAEITRLSGNYEHGKQQVASYSEQLSSAMNTQRALAATLGEQSDAAKNAQKRVNDLSNSLNRARTDTSGYRNGIIQTTSELQKQTSRTAEAAVSVHRLSSAVKSVHGESWFGGLARGINNFDARIKASTSHTRAWASSVRNGAMMAGAAFTALGAGLGKSVQMAATLQQSWVTTRNLLQTGAKNAADARKEVGHMSEMERDATRYSKEYGFSQKEVADQYTELVKRGYTATESIGSMKSMLQAARASGDDYGDVVKNVSSAVDAFGLRSRHAATMVEHTRRVTNAMAFAADQTATDFKGMGEAMSYVSTSAHQARQTVETTTAAIGELSNAGIEGTRAGTGIRKIMNSLVKPTKDATAALQKYGMSMNDFKDKNGALKQLPDIMATINKHLHGISKTERGAFFKAVFGTTGQQAANVLSQNAKAMDELIDKEHKAEKENYVQNLAKKNMASTQMQMKQLEMQVQAFAIQIGTVLLPAVNKVGQAISKWAQSNQGKATLKEFSNGVKAAGNAIADNAGSIITFLGGFADGVMSVAKVMGTFVSWIGKGIAIVGRLFHASSSVPKVLGEIAGGLVGITVAVKVLHGLFGGVSAVIQDGKTLFNLGKQTSEIQRQDNLMQEMINLQEKSLALTKDQAQAQAGNTQSMESSVEGRATGSATENVASTATSDVEKDITKDAEGEMLNAGERAGTGYLAGFLAKAGKLNRLLLGLVMPTGMLDAGAKIGSKLLAGISTSFHFAGRIILKPFLAIGNLGKTIGTKFASAFARAGGKISDVFNVLKNSKIGTFVGRWGIPETFKKIGLKAAEAFRAAFSRLRIVFHPSQWFKAVEPAAKDAGEKAGGDLVKGVGETATKSSLLGTIGKTIAKGIADPLMLALGAIDIMRAWNTSTHKSRAKNVGGAIGNLVGSMAGMKAGAALGEKLGTVGGPIGMIAGTLIGGVLGSTIGKVAGPSLAKFGHGAAKSFELIFKKHDWKGMFANLGKSWKQFWHGMGDWWDQVIGKKTKKSSSSKKSDDDNEHRYKGTKVRYSKGDVATLKAMTTAIDQYKKSLKSLKDTVKRNDPTKEMNKMLSKLKGNVKGWEKLAKPIKKIGDAFKTLSTFSKSMSKKDAFETLNKDLPKLDSTLKKYGKNIKSKLDDLGKAFASKKLISPLKNLTKQIEDSTKKWKAFDTPIKSLAKSFKTLQSATKTMAGKNGLESLQEGFTDLDNALKNQKIGKNLKSLATEINKSGIDKKLSSMNSTVKNSAKNWKNLASPVNTAAKAFQTMAKAVDVLNGVGTGKQGKSKGSKSGLDGVARSVQNLSSTLKKYPFGQQIKNQAKLATDAMNGNSKKGGGFATQFTKMTNGMTTSIKNFGKAFKKNWAQPWKNLGRPVSQGMSSAESTLSHRLNAMQNKREDFSSAFLKGWNSWIDDVKTSFRRGFDKLPGYAENAMRKIIDRMNRGIGGVNKVIGDFGGDKKLSTISYANGTRGGHPGGHMLVNDSQGPHWKELVKFPGKQWTMFNDRNTLIPNAPQGTQVLNGEVTHSIMNALGVHRYANGSLSDEEQEKMAEEFENNPKKAAKDLFLKETDWTSNVPVIADFGKAMAIGFSQAIANVLKDLLGEVKEPVNGDWTPVIKSAAAHMHVHLAEWQIQKLLRQIWTESKGVETQRQLGPSDDPDGDGSGRALGLLQFKRSTFNTWALPGHHNIFSGYDQIMAAIHALNSGGEGGWGNIGEGHGWANGGIVFSEQLSHVAEGGFPESIIPLDLNKRPRAQAILRKTVQAMDNDGGGSGLRSVGSNRQTNSYLKQVVAILGQIAGLNAEQVNAILSINPGTDMNNRRQRSKFFNQYGSDQRIRDYQAF